MICGVEITAGPLNKQKIRGIVKETQIKGWYIKVEEIPYGWLTSKFIIEADEYIISKLKEWCDL